MRKSVPDDIKKLAIKSRKTGMTLAKIRDLLLSNGYNVSLQSINNWCNAAKDIHGARKEEKTEFDIIAEQQLRQRRIFMLVQAGQDIAIKIEVRKECASMKPLYEMVTKKVRVLSKYKHFVMCTDGKEKYCVDKMSIIGIYRPSNFKKVQ